MYKGSAIKMRENVTPRFSNNLSNAIQNISNEKYKTVKVNEEDGLIIETENGNYVPADLLSIGTIDGLYLTLRISSIKELTKEELDTECSKCIVIKTDDTKKATVILEKELNTTNYQVVNNEEIRLYDYLEQSQKINKVLVKNDVNIKQIQETGISLEDYFKSLISSQN